LHAAVNMRWCCQDLNQPDLPWHGLQWRNDDTRVGIRPAAHLLRSCKCCHQSNQSSATAQLQHLLTLEDLRVGQQLPAHTKWQKAQHRCVRMRLRQMAALALTRYA
jgi:hypothetical protein